MAKMTKTELAEATAHNEAELFQNDNDKKRDNVKVFMRYKELADQGKLALTERRLEHIKDCGRKVKYAVTAFRDAKRVMYDETCKDKFCPRCQELKAFRDTMKILAVSTVLKEREGLEPIFMTLTIPNVIDLKEGMNKLNEGFRKLMLYKAFKQFGGWIAKLEVTRNEVSKTYHPHLHVLLFAPKSYFRKSNAGYLKQEELLKMWQRATKDKSINQVRLEAVREGKGLMGVSLEMAKYVAKSKEFAVNNEVFLEFYSGLKFAKLVRYKGKCEEYAQAYEVDKYGVFNKLMNVNKPDLSEFVDKVVLSWHFKGEEYALNTKPLTADEKKHLKDLTKTKTKKDFMRLLTATQNRVPRAMLKDAQELDMLKEQRAKVKRLNADKRTSAARKAREDLRLETMERNRRSVRDEVNRESAKLRGLKLLGQIAEWLDDSGKPITKPSK